MPVGVLVVSAAVSCYDCGLPYKSDRYFDFVVPNDVWQRISPTHNEGGILCIGCAALRCAVLGIECGVKITSGPFTCDWRSRS